MAKRNTRRSWLGAIRSRLAWMLGIALLAPIFMAAAQLVEPDVLIYPQPQTVYDAQLTLTGLARARQAVVVEVNGVEAARTRTNESGDFAVVVRLPRGPNKLRLRMPDARFASDSGELRVSYVPSVESARTERAAQQAKSAGDAQLMMALNPPVLDALPATAATNPITISGTAPASSEIRFFVNGRYTRATIADGSGAFSTWVPLEDATNALYAVAASGGETSAASNTVETSYANGLARSHSGSISQNTVWTRGDGMPYSLAGNLTVAPGTTLWIQPGALINAGGNYKLTVQGHLVVAGTAEARASFKATASACNGTARRTDWLGIEVAAGGLADLDYAQVQCADAGVNFLGGTGSVRRSRIVNNNRGVRTQGLNASSVIAPVIASENEFNNNTYGASVQKNSDPSISGNNVFGANQYAMTIEGGAGASQMQDPRPVIIGNQILPTNSTGIFTGSFKLGKPPLINAQSNWWGVTNHSTIALEIDDWHDATNLDSNDQPIVDFTGYLDGPNGAPFFAGTTLIGNLTANEALGGEVQTLGTIIVDPGVSLSMSAGSRLVAAAGSKILVRGSFSITGTANSRAVIRPTTPACDGVNQERSDWTGIEVAAGATAAINYAEIHCAALAIYFKGGTGEVHNSRLLNSGRGVQTQAIAPARIAPDITVNNEFRGNTYGVLAYINSSPTIGGGNQFADNDYGVWIEGNDITAQNPAPVLQGNSFLSSRNRHVYGTDFGASRSARIDASGNWWGTASPGAISGFIYDWSDNTTDSPIIDYAGYLNAANGTAAWTGPSLNGPINANRTLAATEHLMLGRVEVDAGVSVNVPAGARISPVTDLSFLIYGTLNVLGTETSRAVFRPLATACTDTASDREDWSGLLFQVGSAGAVDFADVRCARNGVFTARSFSITNSRFLANNVGIYVQGGSTTAVAAPSIQGNEIRNNGYGIYVNVFSNPTIDGGNLITANDRGIQFYGNNGSAARPSGAVNANAIHGNTSYNFFASNFISNASGIVLNARDNWWGTPNPTVISPTIYDRKNSTASPHVDFSGYLDATGGAPVFAGTSLIGPVDTDRTLAAGAYEVLGTLTVAAGKTLSISPGADLRFVPGRALVVNGTLSAVGTPTQRIVFGSVARVPGKGDWYGVQVLAGGTMHIEQARIEHSTYGFVFTGGQGSVKESLCRFNTYGVLVESKSSPVISPNNEITLNDYGVGVIGDSSTALNNPLPVTTGNNIYSNATNNFYARGFINPSSTTLNATGNWWGLTDPAAIRATIYTGSSTSPTVDIGTPLAAATGPLALNLTGVATTIRQIRPLDSASVAQGVFTISRGGSVKTQIRRHSDYALVYEYEQSFANAGQYGFTWDGRDASDARGAIAAPGMYRAVLTASDGRDWMRADFNVQSGVATTSGSASSIYRPYRNEFYKGSVTLAAPGLISMQITPLGGTSFYAWENIYYPAGTHWVYWDGRDLAGNIVTSEVEILTTDSNYVAVNAIQVLSAKPVITGVLPAPNIEVKADPYLVTHSYEQITRMAYRLSDDAFVRFVLLPPGDTDIRGPTAIVLLDNALLAAKDGSGAPNNHVIEWRGYDPDHPSQIRVAPEGAYTFAIEARSASTNQNTVYRGAVNLRQ